MTETRSPSVRDRPAGLEVHRSLGCTTNERQVSATAAIRRRTLTGCNSLQRPQRLQTLPLGGCSNIDRPMTTSSQPVIPVRRPDHTLMCGPIPLDVVACHGEPGVSGTTHTVGTAPVPRAHWRHLMAAMHQCAPLHRAPPYHRGGLRDSASMANIKRGLGPESASGLTKVSDQRRPALNHVADGSASRYRPCPERRAWRPKAQAPGWRTPPGWYRRNAPRRCR